MRRAARPWSNRRVRACWIVLVGCGRVGFDPSSPPLPPPDDAITTFTGPHADPTMLPLATGQTETPNPPAASLSAGESYVDPISGIRIWKLTDASSPEANTDARTERELGGAQVSAAFDGDTHTVAVVLQVSGQGKRFLIDLRRGTGIVTTRALVTQGGEDTMSFTADPTTPRVLFAGDGGSRLHRIDTATNTKVDVAPFPIADVYALPNVTAAARVVVAQNVNSGFVALNTTTGAIDVLPTGGSEIPTVDHDGLFLTTAVSGPSTLWRIGETSTTEWIPPTGDFQASTGVSGGFVAVDVDTGNGMAFYFSDPLTRTHRKFGDYGGYDDVHLSSQWIQTDVAVDQQWVLYTTAEQGFPGFSALDDAIGFLQLTGELRFLAHHYAANSPSYYRAPRACLSPDGRMVVFTSPMGPETNRTDVYVAEVPLSP